MTEELNQFCTDLKELFMKQDFPAMETLLENRTPEDIAELARSQQGIIAGYYNQQKFELILRHLNFVAFVSYLYEYAGKKGYLPEQEFQHGFELFLTVYHLIQQLRQEQPEQGAEAAEE